MLLLCFVFTNSVMFLFCAYAFANTYGLLESDATANVKPAIGKWNITLNEINITVEKSLTIDDFIYADNENVEEGYFAPGSEASYEIIIDPKDTDVSIRYDISMDLLDLTIHPNINFELYADNVKVDNIGGTYSGVILLEDIKNKETVTLTISLVWENDDDYNEFDSFLIGDDISFDIPITIKFSQYLGEDL